MSNDTPQTMAAAQSRIAELQRQLALADEGVSRLAERSLALEQQLLACQAELEKACGDDEELSSDLTLPQLFYDCGTGFTQRYCLTVSDESYNARTHEVSAVFELPRDARALRMDPGELPCCITDLEFSDERLTARPLQAVSLPDGELLFMAEDPNVLLESTAHFTAGLKFAVSYRYYPLAQLQNQQPGRTVVGALDVLRAQNDALEQKLIEVHESFAGERAQLQQQICDLHDSQTAYEASLEGILGSSSWKLTAPLRKLLGLFRH